LLFFCGWVACVGVGVSVGVCCVDGVEFCVRVCGARACIQDVTISLARSLARSRSLSLSRARARSLSLSLTFSLSPGAIETEVAVAAAKKAGGQHQDAGHTHTPATATTREEQYKTKTNTKTKTDPFRCKITRSLARTRDNLPVPKNMRICFLSGYSRTASPCLM
jgi:hypothetical protein